MTKQPTYRRKGRSPANQGIVILESEDGRDVPVTAELADMLAGPEEPEPMGGYGASAPLADAGGSRAGTVVPGAPQGENVIEGYPTETADVPFMMGAPDPHAQAAPTMRVDGLPPDMQVTPDQNTGTQVPGVGPVAGADPAAAAQLPVPPPAPPGQAITGDPNAQAAQTGLGGAPGPTGVLMGDYNNNGTPDVLEPRGGGGPSARIVTSTTQRAPISPWTRDSLESAGQDQEEANRRLIEAQAGGLDRLAGIEEETRQAVGDHDLEEVGIQQKAVAAVRQMTNQRAEAGQRLMSGRVDPERYLGSRGTSGRVGAAIAMTLRDLAGIYAGRDLGPTLIEREIDRDIAAQETNLAQAGREFEAGGQLLREMRQVFGDEQDARTAARATLLEDAIRRVRVATLENSSAEVRARGAAIEAALALQLQQTLAQLEQNAFTRTITETRRVGGGGGPRGPMMTPEIGNAYTSAYRAEHGENGPGPGVPMMGFRFTSPQGERLWNSLGTEEQTAVRRQQAMGAPLLQDLMLLRRYADDYSSLDTSERASAEGLAATVLPRLNQFYSGTPNALQEAEAEMWNSAARTPTNFWTLANSNRAALDSTIGSARRILNYQRRAYGFEMDQSALQQAQAQSAQNAEE